VKPRLILVLLAVMSLTAQPTMADITAGLVAQYHFNGNANDTSGNGHDGTVYGAYMSYEDNSDNDYNFDTGYYPPVGSWTHLTVTRASNDDLEIYINGNSHSQWSSTPQPTTNCFQDLLIGAYWYSPSLGNQYLSGFFPGSIDEVMLYNRILSVEEIGELAVIPAPSAFILVSLGAGLTGRLRRRRTL
jgi:hypothetical protein